MPKINETDTFKGIKSKLDNTYLIRLQKLVRKIIQNPEIGKPMQYERKGTRELYLAPFRVSYTYDPSSDILTFLELYHKKKQ
ncbi:MAG: type II toxin-antitoxin system RelE/ParE family toxin [Nanoarchaeota archaeon]